MEILSVSSSFLITSDIQKITKGFIERLGNIHDGVCPHKLGTCELTLAYQGEKQAVFVRESDAHNAHCDCHVCARVRELLSFPAQEFTSNNIWGPTTRLLPFDETGDRKIFLAHVAHNYATQINTDPFPIWQPPEGSTEYDADIHFPIGNHGDTFNVFTGRKRRNVTPQNIRPVGYVS